MTHERDPLSADWLNSTQEELVEALREHRAQREPVPVPVSSGPLVWASCLLAALVLVAALGAADLHRIAAALERAYPPEVERP
jgi:hypothetical protein